MLMSLLCWVGCEIATNTAVADMDVGQAKEQLGSCSPWLLGGKPPKPHGTGVGI